MSIRVLLVDDTPDDLRRIRAALHEHAELYVVGEATNGPEAIAQGARLSPDIVVLDTGMPELAGQHVLGRLRRHLPHAKVVVFSGSAPDDGEAIDGFASKDSQVEYLVELLETIGRGLGPHALLNLEHSLDSARLGREFARATLVRWGVGEAIEDALVVVSELVSNAIRHAHGGCELRLLLTASAIRIECCDQGAGTPDPLPPSSSRPYGRGLNLIDALATAWGVDPVPTGGKIVWAELPRARSLV